MTKFSQSTLTLFSNALYVVNTLQIPRDYPANMPSAVNVSDNTLTQNLGKAPFPALSAKQVQQSQKMVPTAFQVNFL